MKNKKSRNVGRREIIFTIIFLLLVCIPLGLIPVFPEIGFFNALYTNSIALLGLICGATIVAMIVDKLLFGKDADVPD
ncbi:hypothetical protein ACO0K9_12045 [Undibacterium sp. Ji50W]|uniref:hypothetical protein n=1 Tax=Undibacterium sp. Ji50W TaxID=3413041 RepID=UPI003BF11780